jgi:hypothetical protein
MTRLSTCKRTEPAQRATDGVERNLALDVYYHPFAYRGSSNVDYDDSRLAA